MSTLEILDGFKLLGLSDKIQTPYNGAKDYATRFKKVSILDHVKISYSNKTVYTENTGYKNNK